jgi:hypothetical protein
MEQEFRIFLSSAERFGTKLRRSECFSCLQKGSKWNSKHFYLSEWFGTDFRAFLSTAERLGTKFRVFSVQQHRRNSDEMDPNFHLFRVPRNNFLLGKWQPKELSWCALTVALTYPTGKGQNFKIFFPMLITTCQLQRRFLLEVEGGDRSLYI